jgi:hypothetical protein
MAKKWLFLAPSWRPTRANQRFSTGSLARELWKIKALPNTWPGTRDFTDVEAGTSSLVGFLDLIGVCRAARRTGRGRVN